MNSPKPLNPKPLNPEPQQEEFGNLNPSLRDLIVVILITVLVVGLPQPFAILDSYGKGSSALGYVV